MVLNTRESRLNTLWWNSVSFSRWSGNRTSCCSLSLFQRDFTGSDGKLMIFIFCEASEHRTGLQNNKTCERFRSVNAPQSLLCHILHFLNFTRQRWSTNVCERVAVFVCWLPFSCSSAKMFVKPMKRLTNIRSWNHNNQKWCRAIRSNWGRGSNWDPLLK